MPAFTLRSFPPFVLLGALLALALLNPISREPSAQALRFAGETQQSSTQRAQSDAGGQTASPNPGDRGAGQEERVRQQLAKEYEQRFGASDEAIRNALGIRGKVADFVGYNARTTRWLIAESKGSNISTAYEQLENTLKSLLKKYPSAQVELHIYVDAETYSTITSSEQLEGWVVNAKGSLGWYNNLREWIDAEIADIRIQLFVAP